nr:ankyrin repeat domain-containing protein [Haloplasma contractile]
MKLLKILLYTGLFPFTLFLLVRELLFYFKNKNQFNHYSYERYKQNKNWVPTLHSNPLTVIIATSIILGMCLSLMFVFELLDQNVALILGIFILILVYANTVMSNKRMVKQVVKNKHIYRLGVEQEVYIENKVDELKNQIKIKELKNDLKGLETIFDYIESSKRNTTSINDVLGYEELIYFQFNAIRNFYDKQLEYLNAYENRIRHDVEESIKYKGNLLKNIKEDLHLMRQMSVSRELVDELLRYIANFNSFMKHNIASIIDLTEPLSQEFINYLERIRALRRLTPEQYFDMISGSLSDMELEQVKALIDSRREVLTVSDPNGNSLLHHAVMNNKLPLAEFLLNNDISVNLKNKSGYTALHYANKNNNQEMINFLMKRGAFIEFVIHDLNDENDPI